MIAKIANTIRGLVADMVEKANSGHPGMPLGMAKWEPFFIRRYCATIRPFPTGPTGIASYYPPAMAPPCFTPYSI